MEQSNFKFWIDFIDVDGSIIEKEYVKVRIEYPIKKKLRPAVKVLVEVYADERMIDLDANSWRIR